MIEPQAIWQTLDFVYRALLRHRRVALGVTVSLGLLITAGVWFMPKTYLSEAKVFVRFGRENQLDPTASTGQAISINETRESEINSLQEILRSRALLDRVVDTLGPDYILKGKNLPHGPELTPVSAKTGNVERDSPLFVPTQQHQLAVKKLEKDLEIFNKLF